MTESPSGAIPSDSTKNELEDLLEADTSRLGDVYRLSNQGMSAEVISEELGVSTSTFVSSYRLMCRAILEGRITEFPSVARRHASRFRSILEHSDLSDEARKILEQNLRLLEANAADQSAIEKEIVKAKEGSRSLEERLDSEQLAGVYVYSFPTYILHPKKETTGQVLYKVGHSEDDVGKRINRQAKTSMPENPIVLRVYEPSVDSPAIPQLEARFHKLLNAALHDWDEGGKEWFLTTLEFLDEVALALGLAVYVNEGVDGLD